MAEHMHHSFRNDGRREKKREVKRTNFGNLREINVLVMFVSVVKIDFFFVILEPGKTVFFFFFSFFFYHKPYENYKSEIMGHTYALSMNLEITLHI